MTVTTIAVMTGDPSGVGPEISAKLIEARQGRGDLRIAVFSGEESLADGLRIAGLGHLRIPAVDDVASMPECGVAVIRGLDRPGYTPGQASAAGGAASLTALKAAAHAASLGLVDAVVYGPLNKQAMWLAGHHAIDELHFFCEQLGAKGFSCEINNQGDIWTSRVTSHIPLRAVAENITVEKIIAATRAGAAAVCASSGKKPRIAVAGLNPHLGEGGAMGREEIDVILPAIERLKAMNYDVAGLFPADTVFLRLVPEKIDLVITMFHDQGQIALKALGFNSTTTVLAGLPLPIVTASQGTAYDIVGQNRANPAGLTAAFDLACRLASAKYGTAS
jgi:4-hydroxy-L-threonine phosphate dehydrogenase PdxA